MQSPPQPPPPPQAHRRPATRRSQGSETGAEGGQTFFLRPSEGGRGGVGILIARRALSQKAQRFRGNSNPHDNRQTPPRPPPLPPGHRVPPSQRKRRLGAKPVPQSCVVPMIGAPPPPRLTPVPLSLRHAFGPCLLRAGGGRGGVASQPTKQPPPPPPPHLSTPRRSLSLGTALCTAAVPDHRHFGSTQSGARRPTTPSTPGGPPPRAAAADWGPRCSALWRRGWPRGTGPSRCRRCRGPPSPRSSTPGPAAASVPRAPSASACSSRTWSVCSGR